MAVYDSDLQAAVDATSIAHDTGETDLVDFLVDQLAERNIATEDRAWLERMVEGIRSNRNYLIDSEPDDYEPDKLRPSRDQATG